MNYNRFWLLAAKRLSGDATKEELCELDMLMSEYPEAFQLFNDAEKAWTITHDHVPQKLTQDKLIQLRKRLDGVNEYNNEKIGIPGNLIQNKKKIILVPTALLIAIAAFFFINRSSNIPSAALVKDENAVVVQKGSKTKITLPDGSTVLLNADSRIYYSNDFKTNRELRLEGEAFFDVVRDVKRPFIIHTTEMDVKVLGTTFNVRSYPDESLIEAALIKGSIEVTLRNRKEQPILLKPNEKISITTEKVDVITRQREKVAVSTSPVISIKPLKTLVNENVITEIAWTENKLYLQGERLDQTALILERWFGKKIRVENENLKSVRYTANFETETLEQVLQALQLSVPFRYRTENETIIIY